MSTQPARGVYESAPSNAPNLTLVSWQFEPAISSLISGSHRLENRWYEVVKRTVDVVISSLALVLGSPLFLLIAIAVRVTSTGPAIFAHGRIGRNGREFRCYKFRTMVSDAETRLHQCAELRMKFEQRFKLDDDPRVTPLGNLLRRCSLDELPQFWNVLKGDMTLIGPRPIVRQELAFYGPYAGKLQSVPPGLSGLWQTCGRSETTYELRVQLDMLYIDHHSFWLDMVLLFRTIVTVVRRAGAR